MPTTNHAPDPRRGSLEDVSLWPIERLSVKELRSHIKAVIQEMANNRDVMTHDDGRPMMRAHGSNEEPGRAWVRYHVNLSGIGMPYDSNLTVESRRGDNFVTWTYESTVLASVPKGKTAKETADILNMTTLLNGFFGHPTPTRPESS